jgi:hypothetical protein
VTVTVVQLRPHAAAVAAVLTAAFNAVSPVVPLGVGRKLDDTTAERYAVLWPLTPQFDGPIADDAADVVYAFQVTSVGRTVEMVEAVADLARTALLTNGVAVAGRWVDPVNPTGGSGIQRDDALDPAVFFRAETYTVRTAPA